MHDTTFLHSWKCWERFHVICIQENWLGRTSDFFLVQIDGYNCFYCDKRSELSIQGGVITNVDNNFEANDLSVRNDGLGNLFESKELVTQEI